MSVERSSFDVVWRRVEAHADQTFRTTTGLEFTYRVRLEIRCG